MFRVDVLTPNETLLEQLRTIELAGRTCYQSVRGPITVDTARRFCSMLLRRGHESVIEHGSMTVRFSGVSRGFTHELVRHRICAFSQESTRYVDEKETGFVLPPAMRGNEQAEKMSALILGFYREMRLQGFKPEDARQFLPIGMENEIVATANFREWRHIVRVRTVEAAHWEIRAVIGNLLEQVRGTLCPLFDEFVRDDTCRSGVACYVSQRT